MPNYSWPPMDKRRVMGKPIKRLDGPVKSSGRAKYNSDVHPQGMLWATLVTSSARPCARYQYRFIARRKDAGRDRGSRH